MIQFRHISLERTRPYVFLPVNLTAGGGKAPALAVCDTATADEFPNIYKAVWRTAKSGTVFRQYVLRNQRDEEGRPVRSTEQLAHVVLGSPPFSPTYAANGDPLDCRAENIRMALHAPAARMIASGYFPGRSVKKLEGYNEALQHVLAFRDEYINALARSRSARLSNADVLRLLEAVSTGAMVGGTLGSIADWAAEELGTRMHVNQIRNILKGASLPQPGFDYAALRASRPTARERALARWKETAP